MRTEKEIFDDLATLCTSPGYVHAIAHLSFRDDLIRYAREITVEDMKPMFSPSRLIRTEISTLIGLLVKKEIDYSLPSPEILQQYLDGTDGLLKEMHEAMTEKIFDAVSIEQLAEKGFKPFSQGEALREPIFYSGESAYSFQYCDFAPRKYAADDEWLKTNKGFTIKAARDVVRAVQKLQSEKLTEQLNESRHLPPNKRLILPGFTFTLQEASQASAFDEALVESVLRAFMLPIGEMNQGFCSLHDFNAVNATPLLFRSKDRMFILFTWYSLCEALYESPFYWMASDKNYASTAMVHRGQFSEDFSRERLELVFGKNNVHSNVKVYESRNKICGEIDVLVLFANRAIVLQAKSKRLTLEARRGNDGQIKEDFQKSVQDSYDQAYKCAQLLGNPKYKLIGLHSRQVNIPTTPKEVYILCVVSDAYPALNFQAQELLRFKTTETIRPPLITDVFTLDAMTEMLESPLHFLSYMNRRTGYHGRLLARDEMTILSYHLKKNLWIEDAYDMAVLDDEFAADLDVAMTVRRDNVPGKRTPEGVLTRIAATAVGRILNQIETEPDQRTIDLGLMLLRLSENAVLGISRGIDAIARRARRDGKNHDITVPISEGGTGLTVHCNDDAIYVASRRLQGHCEARKYTQKANSWFGICLSPNDISIRFGLNLDYEWQSDAEMDSLTRNLPRVEKLAKGIASVGRKRKVGRNDPCPCRSGLKYKKCCLK